MYTRTIFSPKYNITSIIITYSSPSRRLALYSSNTIQPIRALFIFSSSYLRVRVSSVDCRVGIPIETRTVFRFIHISSPLPYSPVAVAAYICLSLTLSLSVSLSHSLPQDSDWTKPLFDGRRRIIRSREREYASRRVASFVRSFNERRSGRSYFSFKIQKIRFFNYSIIAGITI